jgi:formiminoglutamase
MTWNTQYVPPDPNQWQGRADVPSASCFFQAIQMLNLLEGKAIPKQQLSFALVGFRCDEGVHRNQGRPGAIEGPTAIRQALSKFPVQRPNIICYDAGNILCPDNDLEAAQTALSEVIALLLQENLIPIVLGGGHELAFGHYQGIAKVYRKENLGIVNFDAHFDMRTLLEGTRGTSGTSFLQIALANQALHKRFDYNCVGIQHSGNIKQLFETAKLYDVHFIFADDLHMGLIEKCTDFIDRIIDANDLVYMSLCMDVFAAAFAPGVSAIQPLGLTPWNVIPLLRQLSASGKVVSFDVAELAPRYDIDQRTTKLAAGLIYEFIHHYNTQLRPW